MRWPVPMVSVSPTLILASAVSVMLVAPAVVEAASVVWVAALPTERHGGDLGIAAQVDADLLAHDKSFGVVHRQVCRTGGKIKPGTGRDIDEYLGRRCGCGSRSLDGAAFVADDDLRTAVKGPWYCAG